MKDRIIALIGSVAFCLLGIGPCLYAQDVEGFWSTINQRIAERDYLRINGGIDASTQFNSIQGIPRRTDPFGWRLNANLQLDFLGIQAPFSAAFSDGNPTYNLPGYAFYGMSPSYQWITLHLGDRSLRFSPYTLSGHNFYGIGTELRPGKFYIGAMYGRLRRARAEDITAIQNIEPIYQRMGYGLKVGYEDEGNELSLMLFKAQDETGSIPFPLENSTVQPMDNAVLGLTGKRKIGKLFQVDLDFARSALSRDRRAQLVQSAGGGLFRTMLGLFQPRVSTGYHNAVKLGARYTPQLGQFALEYERIDPGYRTLGALFFNNDLENITGSAALPLFNNKVNLATRVGLQRNDLDGEETSAFNRFIGSLNLSATLTDQLSWNIGFSNFTTTNRIRTISIPFVQVDSIVLAQTNLSANTALAYALNKEKTSLLTGMFSYQQTNTIENDEVDLDQRTRFYLGMLSHSYTVPDADFSLQSSCLVNVSQNPVASLLTVGPSVQVSKGILDKKLTLTLNSAYSLVYTAGTRSNNVLTLQGGTRWQVNKKQEVGLQLSYVAAGATPVSIDSRAFNEFTGRLRYGFRF